MFQALYSLMSSTNTSTTESLPVASAVSVETYENNIFYGTDERTIYFEEPGIRVYGSHDDNPIVYASAVNQTTLDVTDDEAYFAAHPPASSAGMTLRFFNMSRSQETSELLNKSAICMTNERQSKAAENLNAVEITAQPSRAQQYAYARKTSLFFTDEVQEINPEDYQMVIHSSAKPS